ncbi:site-specific integrase [Arthrobacter sp. efr-133-TYG-118]|uniref:site-specific integrase n=1 Tax=Arthrobacter sp. efr-133-TYG-118 TaxID=3040279 RepID=UPI00254FE774|nr:site-specific integrase [Arthrobacter sp. efr-133-TYG-118]
MINNEDVPRDLSCLVVPLVGSLEATEDLFVPYRLVDGRGSTVARAAAFFAELIASGRPATTQRSYGMDLLRWFRFLWALGVGWNQATRVEARDFIRWLQVAAKPTRARIGAIRLVVPGIGRRPGRGQGERGDRQAVWWRSARACDGGALRERAARLL